MYDPESDLSTLCTQFVIPSTESADMMESGYADDPAGRIRIQSLSTVPASLAREFRAVGVWGLGLG
jgi:hypothetical protein